MCSEGKVGSVSSEEEEWDTRYSRVRSTVANIAAQAGMARTAHGASPRLKPIHLQQIRQQASYRLLIISSYSVTYPYVLYIVLAVVHQLNLSLKAAACICPLIASKGYVPTQ